MKRLCKERLCCQPLVPWNDYEYTSRIWIVHDENLNESDWIYEKSMNGNDTQKPHNNPFSVPPNCWKLFFAASVRIGWR